MPTTRHSYHNRDYAFGQTMLKLRSSIGLTQAGLANLLEVSRRAIGEWESGSSYPKASHLQHVLALCVQQHAFEPGREEEEIRALWKMAHQRVLLDEPWLAALLAGPPSAAAPVAEAGEAAAPPQLSPQTETPVVPTRAEPEPAASPHVDWVGALDVSQFTGREVEVAELTQWMVQERCRMVTLLGMGGIGKSTLASFLGVRLASQFEAVLWRSVRDAPSSRRRRPLPSPHHWSSASTCSWPACRRGAACWCSTTWRRCSRVGTPKATTCRATVAMGGSSSGWRSRRTRAASC